MPRAIPEGLTQQHVLLALEDLDAGIEHPFGPPTGYELVHAGKLRLLPAMVLAVDSNTHVAVFEVGAD